MWAKLVPWGTVPTEEALAAFFDDASAADASGVADRSTASKRALRWFLGRIEAVVGAHGPFAVGSKLSLADVQLFYVLGDVVASTPENAGSAHRLEPFSSAKRVNAVLAGFPKVKAIVEHVRADARLQKYLATRPATA